MRQSDEDGATVAVILVEGERHASSRRGTTGAAIHDAQGDQPRWPSDREPTPRPLPPCPAAAVRH